LTDDGSKFLFDPPSTRSGIKILFDDDGDGKISVFILKIFPEISEK